MELLAVDAKLKIDFTRFLRQKQNDAEKIKRLVFAQSEVFSSTILPTPFVELGDSSRGVATLKINKHCDENVHILFSSTLL